MREKMLLSCRTEIQNSSELTALQQKGFNCPLPCAFSFVSKHGSHDLADTRNHSFLMRYF